eukprot:gene1193-2685_t
MPEFVKTKAEFDTLIAGDKPSALSSRQPDSTCATACRFRWPRSLPARLCLSRSMSTLGRRSLRPGPAPHRLHPPARLAAPYRGMHWAELVAGDGRLHCILVPPLQEDCPKVCRLPQLFAPLSRCDALLSPAPATSSFCSTELANEFPDAVFVKVDVDVNTASNPTYAAPPHPNYMHPPATETSAAYSVEAMPTFMVFKVTTCAFTPPSVFSVQTAF